MLTIDIKINDRHIAVAHALNVSNLADVSDYIVKAVSIASPVTGLSEQRHDFDLRQHERKQSAWALVAKIAQEIAEAEAKALEKAGA